MERSVRRCFHEPRCLRSLAGLPIQPRLRRAAETQEAQLAVDPRRALTAARTLVSTIAAEMTGIDVVRQVTGKDFVADAPPQLRILDRKRNFDAPIQVARH